MAIAGTTEQAVSSVSPSGPYSAPVITQCRINAADTVKNFNDRLTATDSPNDAPAGTAGGPAAQPVAITAPIDPGAIPVVPSAGGSPQAAPSTATALSPQAQKMLSDDPDSDSSFMAGSGVDSIEIIHEFGVPETKFSTDQISGKTISLRSATDACVLKLKGLPFTGDIPEYTDKFGNVVSGAVERDANGKPVSCAVVISPKAYLAGEGSAPHIERSVDLSGVGINAEWKDAFSLQQLPLAGTYAGKNVCSEVDITPYKEGLEAFIEGSKTAEAAFGLEENGLIKNICVYDSSNYNAFFNRANTDAIWVSTDLLKTSDPGNLRSAGSHETIHAVDDHFKISQNENFIGMFERRSGPGSPYNIIISESVFLETGIGGHPEDDPKELFASLVNSAMKNSINSNTDLSWKSTIDLINRQSNIAPVIGRTYSKTSYYLRDAEKQLGTEMPIRDLLNNDAEYIRTIAKFPSSAR